MELFKIHCVLTDDDKLQFFIPFCSEPLLPLVSDFVKSCEKQIRKDLYNESNS